MLRTILLGAALTFSTAASASDLHRAVTAAAQAHGVPPALAHGVVKAESNYRCHVRASDGLSVGIMQVRPATARGVGVHGSMTNCSNSLRAGMLYLRQALAKFNGNWCLAASAYNRGLYARPACTAYGRRVVSYSRHRLADAGFRG